MDGLAVESGVDEEDEDYGEVGDRAKGLAVVRRALKESYDDEPSLISLDRLVWITLDLQEERFHHDKLSARARDMLPGPALDEGAQFVVDACQPEVALRRG